MIGPCRSRPAAPKPLFFDDAAAFRRWLEKNHAKETELLVGFLKKKPGRTSLTYFEALDEALCFGWIDGVSRSLDADRWYQRFSPRKPKSIWSLVNVRKVEPSRRPGRMAPAGRKAFEARDEKRTGLYSFEQGKRPTFDRAVPAFRAKPGAWAFFQAQPPGYRRLATFWVMSAKKPETRQRRLAAADRRLREPDAASASSRNRRRRNREEAPPAGHLDRPGYLPARATRARSGSCATGASGSSVSATATTPSGRCGSRRPRSSSTRPRGSGAADQEVGVEIRSWEKELRDAIARAGGRWDGDRNLVAGRSKGPEAGTGGRAKRLSAAPSPRLPLPASDPAPQKLNILGNPKAYTHGNFARHMLLIHGNRIDVYY